MQIKSIQLVSKYYYIYIIVLIAIILRAIKFDYYAMFGHDSSRDVILTYKMFTLGEVIYRGPVFSVIWGNLSPLYYYVLAPFHYIFKFHPLSSAIVSNFLNVLAILLATIFTGRFFGKLASIFVGLLLSCSSLILMNAGSGLNPSMTPLFAIGLYYFLAKFLIEDQENVPGPINKKIPLLRNARYLSLIGASICLSFVLAFHPSGAFFIPFLVLIFILKRPKADLWSVLIALGVFIVLFVFPYVIQEKKMAWWTVRRVIEYFQDHQSTNTNLYIIFINFVDAVLRNTSLLLFGNVVSKYVLYTVPIYLVLLYDSFKALINFKQLGYSSLLALTLILYLLTFMLAVPFDEGAFNRQWFGASFIPLVTIYLGIVLARFADKRYLYLGAVVFSIILLMNLKAIYEYKGSSDSYYHRKEIVEFLRQKTNGADFDIYGENGEPIYYMLWHGEKDLNKKEKYKSWFVWSKGKKSNLMYLISRNPENSTSVKNYQTKEEVYTTSLQYKLVEFTR